MKKEKKRFYNRMHKQHLIHPDDPWAEIELANKYKNKMRNKKDDAGASDKLKDDGGDEL